MKKYVVEKELSLLKRVNNKTKEEKERASYLSRYLDILSTGGSPIYLENGYAEIGQKAMAVDKDGWVIMKTLPQYGI